MQALRLILGDQLSRQISSLDTADKKQDVIMLCEVMEEALYVKHHKKKIAFLFSAMRHFASELREEGFKVWYVEITDNKNMGSFESEILRAVNEFNPSSIIVTEPGEWRVLKNITSWKTKFKLTVNILPDSRFLASHEEFKNWSLGKKQCRMEYFYREMRKKYSILMEPDGKPTGGEWNYDKKNRKPLKKKVIFPPRIIHPKSTITKNVLKIVAAYFGDHIGQLEPFHYAVTRKEALMELKNFITKILPHFGDYQDAMLAGEPYLYHSLLSSYLNAGLLYPLEICQMAENAYRSGLASLHSVEGFIRQILGWREYIRGIYWLYMPNYADLNYFKAENPLPDFYWNANTTMACMSEAVKHTLLHAYSHHIQRLMITGNFALIAGINVKEVQEWYLAVYSDAYEWVEMPNTLGMALFGDGGLIASKPYAASGHYINRMSNYCKSCQYDPNLTLGEKACPFNALYWNFIARNEKKLSGNQRMTYVFSTWKKFSSEKKNQILLKSQEIFDQINNGEL